MGAESSKEKARKQSDRFGENLVSEQKRNFHDVYEIVEKVGEGSISNIYKIKKKDHAVGGSSREDFVRSQRGIRWPPFLPSKQAVNPYQNGMTKKPPPTFALKEIDLHLVTPAYIQELYNEIELLKRMDHPNIIKAYETYPMRRKHVSIVMELCTGGDLYSRHPYTEREAANIVGKLLSAVAYMHKNNVIHRDIKYENIMFEDDSPGAEIKLIDFGLAKKYAHKDHIMTKRVGTCYTMAPQVLQGVYTSKADMWSVGVVTFMLLSGEKPFWGATKKRITDKVMRGRYRFKSPAWKYVSNEGRSFVNALLKVDPSLRLSAEEAQKAPWLRKEFKLSDRRPPDAIMEGVKGNLVRYEESGEFRRLVLNVIARKSTTEEIFELRKAFDQFDTDNDGTISMEEFKAVLSEHDYSEEVLEGMFHSVDVNKNGVLMYTEFLAATLEAQGFIEEQRVAEAFDQLDSDDTGYITKENLRDVLGKDCSEDYVNSLIAEMDFDGDGKIGWAEFLRAFFCVTQKNDEIQDIYDAGNEEDSSVEFEELLTVDSPIPGGKHDPRKEAN